jgi:hypothetical protein
MYRYPYHITSIQIALRIFKQFVNTAREILGGIIIITVTACSSRLKPNPQLTSVSIEATIMPSALALIRESERHSWGEKKKKNCWDNIK